MAFRPDGSRSNGPGWTLRVVPNKFPVLRIERQLNEVFDGMYSQMDGVGAHEVIIETPEHLLTLSTMPLQSVENVLLAYHMRLSDLKQDKRLKYILIFKNEGEAAGASLEHSHSQLIALPIVPKLVGEELANSQHYYEARKSCIFCDIILREKESRARIISENGHYIALAPFAPTTPFETWILPKHHESRFAPNGSFASLAQILQLTLKQIDAVLTFPPYNMMLHTSPFQNEINNFYHWHIEIKPKLTTIAGFEWGSGFYINPTPPEEAAEFMRASRV